MQGAAFPRDRLHSLPVAFLLAMAVVLIGGLIMQIRFLPLSDLGIDGFQSQLVRVIVSLSEGSVIDDSADGWLIFVHVARLLSVLPFLAGEVAFGPPAQLALLMAALWPLVLLCYRKRGGVLCLVPLLLPLAVSGRAVLVAAGVAYIVLYMQSSHRRAWHLWLGLLWVPLSSASVLMAVLLLMFARPHAGAGPGMQRWLGLVYLTVLLGISMVDKLSGFESGGLGYEAHAFASDNVVLVAISRSTIATSFFEGQYARATIYSLAAVYIISKLFVLLMSPGQRNVRIVVLCCLPGIALEGLGMLGLLFPLLWLFLKYDVSAQGPQSEGRVG